MVGFALSNQHSAPSFSGSCWRKDDGGAEQVLSSTSWLRSSSEAALAISEHIGEAYELDSLDALQLSPNRTRPPPGPGAYVWNNDVIRERMPVWTMTSPDRKNLLGNLPSWCPASSSSQDSSGPGPTSYSNVDYQIAVGRNGRLGAPQYSLQRSVQGFRKPLPPPKFESPTQHYAMVGALHPTRGMPASALIQSTDRSLLPAGVPTWIPRTNAEQRPGPGQYDLVGGALRPRPKVRTRCTFGERPTNLSPMGKSWVPSSHGSNPPSSEHLRYKRKL